MRWFRFYSETLHDPKVRRLPDKLFRHWVNILCLASMGNPRGALPCLDDIADALRLSRARTVALLTELVERGLLDDDAGTLTPHNWLGRQFDSDARLTEGRQRTDDLRRKDGDNWANPPRPRRVLAAPSPPPRRRLAAPSPQVRGDRTEQNRDRTEGTGTEQNISPVPVPRREDVSNAV